LAVDVQLSHQLRKAGTMKVFADYALLFVLSCSLSTTMLAQGQVETQQRVEISFAGRLAGKPFACGSQYEGVGIKKSTVTPQDLRFFVSDVELLDANGKAASVSLDQDGIWQYKNVALIDLEDGKGGCRNGNAAMHAAVTGNVAAGQYTGVRFTVGVPFELDHISPLSAPSPLNMTAMFWSWQGGYKFIRAEVALVPKPGEATEPPIDAAPSSHPEAPGDRAMRSSGFPVHLGSTGCASASKTTGPAEECKNPNRVLVNLPAFNPAKDVVIFDVGRLLAGSDVTTNTPNTAPGCMSGENDPDCIPIMRALGLPFGNVLASEQAVFYRETK